MLCEPFGATCTCIAAPISGGLIPNKFHILYATNKVTNHSPPIYFFYPVTNHALYSGALLAFDQQSIGNPVRYIRGLPKPTIANAYLFSALVVPHYYYKYTDNPVCAFFPKHSATIKHKRIV